MISKRACRFLMGLLADFRLSAGSPDFDNVVEEIKFLRKEIEESMAVKEEESLKKEEEC